VVIVGLVRELEYRDGAVWPYPRRVIEMPVAVGESMGPSAARPRRDSPAPVVGIRLESHRDRRPFKWVGGALATAILLHVLVTNVMHVGDMRQRSYLELSGRDDYASVVHKLGKPSGDRLWNDGIHRYRALAYRHFTVILMESTYVGTVDSNWRPIHSVEIQPGGTSFSLLGTLKRF
jgi:hypothetical protein